MSLILPQGQKAGFLPLSPVFEPRLLHVGFVALSQVFFFKLLGFPSEYYSKPVHIHIWFIYPSRYRLATDSVL
jgi:hypothetical protein